MSERQAFIVVSTGQNHANLPPVLECAAAGDVVVWVESDEARHGQWSVGARRVLERHGLVNFPTTVEARDINDPVRVAQRLRPIIADLGPSHRLNLVANGGPKLTPIGLLNACQGFPSRLLYGQTKPAELWIFDGAMHRPPEKQPYHRHRLDLEDILTVNNLVLMEAAAPLAWDPAGEAPPDYGFDLETTRRVHADYHRQYRTDPDQSVVEASFGDIEVLRRDGRLSREAYQSWLKSLAPLLQSGFAQDRKHSGDSLPTITDFAARLESKPGLLKTVYQATRLFSTRATAAWTKAAEAAGEPSVHLGRAFEHAVTARVLAHLRSRPDLADVVQSAWKNIKVAGMRNPTQTQAEWDVVLVLRCGILFCIECKSFDAERKDLDARQRNLLRAGSQSEMLVCGPLYTHFAAEPWFPAMHKLREKVGDRDFLPFTLPGQPEAYSFENERGETESHPCPSFEAALTGRLKPYVSSQGGV
jgi:hypothetical protein